MTWNLLNPDLGFVGMPEIPRFLLSPFPALCLMFNSLFLISSVFPQINDGCGGDDSNPGVSGGGRSPLQKVLVVLKHFKPILHKNTEKWL